MDRKTMDIHAVTVDLEQAIEKEIDMAREVERLENAADRAKDRLAVLHNDRVNIMANWLKETEPRQ